mgnify:FL=1|jgi:hypothetical protein
MKALGLDDNKSKETTTFRSGHGYGAGEHTQLLSCSVVAVRPHVYTRFQRTQVVTRSSASLLGCTSSLGFVGRLCSSARKVCEAIHVGKRRGSLLYFLGLLIIVLKVTWLGSLLQLVGLFIIFRPFLPDIYDSITRIPYVGKYLSTSLSYRRKLHCTELPGQHLHQCPPIAHLNYLNATSITVLKA